MSREPTFRSPASRAILLIIIEAVILTVVIIAVFLLLPDRSGDARAVRPVITEVREAEAEPAPPAEVAEVPAPAVPEPPEPVVPETRDYPARPMVAEHVVRAGDTLWDLSSEIWGSRHLWPDLYRFNRGDIPDPDDLTIGFRLQVPESLLSDDGTLSSGAVSHLLDSYVIAYRAYRTAEAAFAERASRTGRRDLEIRSRLKRSRAQWLLYSAHRFDDTFVISRAGDIDPDDIAVVESYLTRFGRPEFSLD
ncbi:MAG: LysM domain-containing protein [Spirochaetaceae bacterium]|nr:MAG: LysM domain-containing protein [Spirochaetaceae bacterium]